MPLYGARVPAIGVLVPLVERHQEEILFVVEEEQQRIALQYGCDSCDAMHGNTRVASNGLKTRRFDEILGELEQAFDIHAACGSYLGGVHIELTGDNVTECMGGARGLTEDDLQRAYKSQVDPRLNYEQALEMAMLIARKMSRLT